MPKTKKTEVKVEEVPTPAPAAPVGLELLAQAIAQATTQALRQAKVDEKKIAGRTYVEKTPWTPPEGTPKLKLKRKMYIHSMLVDPDMHSNEEIAALNKVRPGRYLDNFVTVERRRDKGLNIFWPIKTPDQKMRLWSIHKVRDLVDLCNRCAIEAATPKPDFVADPDDN